MNTPPKNPNKTWYLIGDASQIHDKPFAATIHSQALVFFRDVEGKVAALEDRCLHRQVALSQGRVHEGLLECPYHGARYNGQGQCVHAHQLTESQKLPAWKARKFSVTTDEHNLLWVNLGENPEPFVSSLPPKDARTVVFKYVYRVEAPALFIIENFVDCAHTGFVHRGLFRGLPKKKVKVAVRSSSKAVEVETFGEKDSDSVLARLLNFKGDHEVQHIDKYIPPYTVNVVYRKGQREVETISVCTPIDAWNTQVHTYVFIRYGWLNQFLRLILKPYGKKIIGQDLVILKNQTDVVRRSPSTKPSFFATDVPIIKVMNAYQNYLEDIPNPEQTAEFEMKL